MLTQISGATFTGKHSQVISGLAGGPAPTGLIWVRSRRNGLPALHCGSPRIGGRRCVEIDSLVALMLSVTADQLCTIYRTQFPVLYGYDHKDYVYDTNGRLVPNEVLKVWRVKGERMTGAERTATNQAGRTYIYELPFRLLDREADMREAYAEFERRLAAHE